MQGISSKFLKSHIFFRLAVKKKMRKVVENLCRYNGFSLVLADRLPLVTLRWKTSIQITCRPTNEMRNMAKAKVAPLSA